MPLHTQGQEHSEHSMTVSPLPLSNVLVGFFRVCCTKLDSQEVLGLQFRSLSRIGPQQTRSLTSGVLRYLALQQAIRLCTLRTTQESS